MDQLIQQLRERVSDPLRAVEHALTELPRVPPALASAQLLRAEKLLGCQLPDLLKALYLQVGNGGFGPGYGLFPISLGDPGFADLVGVYWYVRGDARQLNPDTLLDLTKLAEQDLSDEASPAGPADATFDWQWPAGLLPILSHGCGIYECLECTGLEGAVILHHPDYLVAGGSVQDTLTELAPSLQRRLEAWLRGEDLLQRAVNAYGPRS